MSWIYSVSTKRTHYSALKRQKGIWVAQVNRREKQIKREVVWRRRSPTQHTHDITFATEILNQQTKETVDHKCLSAMSYFVQVSDEINHLGQL